MCILRSFLSIIYTGQSVLAFTINNGPGKFDHVLYLRKLAFVNNELNRVKIGRVNKVIKTISIANIYLRLKMK